MPEKSPLERLRLDKWLWAARLYKTRALAAEEAGLGRISVNGQAAKPAREIKPGDLLTFKMTVVHASLDNQTDRIRISSDTRYQRASQPADERWIGWNPAAHGPRAKRGRIC